VKDKHHQQQQQQQINLQALPPSIANWSSRGTQSIPKGTREDDKSRYMKDKDVSRTEQAMRGLIQSENGLNLAVR